MAIVYKNPYQDLHDRAQQELESLRAERKRYVEHIAWIDQRTSALAESIRTTTRLLQVQDQSVQRSLPELCAGVLSSGEAMTVPEIRNRLTLRGVDLSAYANPLAVLHTTLKRMRNVERLDSNGPPRYIWRGFRPLPT